MKKSGRSRLVLLPLVGLCILLCASFVSAQALEFYGFDVVELSACQDARYGLYVINNDVINHSVRLAVAGNASSFVELGFTEFTVPVGLSVLLDETFSVPCTTETGNYSLVIGAQTVRGVQRYDQTVVVGRQFPFAVSIPETLVIPACSEQLFSFEFQNIGLRDTRFTFDAFGPENLSGSFAVDPENLAVSVDAIETLFLNLETDECSTFGTFPFTLNISTQDELDRVSIPFTVTVEPRQFPVLLGTQNFSVSSEENSTLSLTLRNDGSEDATFTFETSENWLVFSEQDDDEESFELFFEGNETQFVNLTVLAPNLTGLHTVTVTVTSEVAEQVFPLYITFGDDSTLHSGLLRSLAVVLIVIVILLIALIFTFRQRISAYVASRKSADSSPSVVSSLNSMSPGQMTDAQSRQKERAQKKEQRKQERLEQKRKREEEKRLAREAKIASRARKEAERELRSSNYLIPREKPSSFSRLWVFFVLLVVLAVIVLTVFFPVVHRILLYAGAGAAGIIVLLAFYFLLSRIFRRTLRFKKYQLAPHTSLKFTLWKKGLTELHLESKDALFKLRASFRQTHKNPGTALPSGLVYTYVTTRVLGSAPEALQGKARFRIKRAWFQQHGQDVDAIQLVEYKNNSWKAHNAQPLGQDPDYYYFEAQITGLYHFALIGKNKDTYLPKPSRFFRTLFVFLTFILFAGAGAIAYFTPWYQLPVQPDRSADAIGPLLLTEGQVFTFDLGSYYADPDQDILTYTYEPMENIVVAIRNGTAQLIPDAGFVGERSTVFYAYDGAGGLAASNRVTVVVSEDVLLRPEQRVSAFVQQYARVVLVFLGILFFLALVWRFSSRRETEN